MELSSCDSLHADAIKHALTVIKDSHACSPDIVVVGLGNTVSIKPEWVCESVNILKKNSGISSVVPVYREQNHHPYRAKYLGEDGLLKTYFDFEDVTISTNRQELPDNFFLCHNFWTLKTNQSIYAEKPGQMPWDFLGSSVFPMILETSVDVHLPEDIEKCERWLIKQGLD